MWRHWNTVARMSNSKNISILTAVCYQPPQLDTQSKQYYCESFCSALTTLSNTHLSLAGDFNDLSPQRTPHRQSWLSCILSSFVLQHLICEPKRWGNIRDCFSATKPEEISNSAVLPPPTSLDHCIIFAEVWCYTQRYHTKCRSAE